MDKKIKFAVIGCGHIGKRHAEMIVRNPDAELVAIVDIKPKEDLGTIQNVPFYSSIEALLAAGCNLDVINICTPNGSHAKYALKALDSGSNVVIEKPIALTKHDAENIICKALSAHKHVFGVMQNRYSPPSIWVKELVDSGIMGKIFTVQMNCYWNRDDRYYTHDSWHGKKNEDGGTLFTQFSHFIDIMYWLFGDIENIHARLFDFNHQNLTDFEDSGLVNFDFLSGAIGSINYSTSVWNKNMESSMTIIGENGTVKIGGQYMDKVETCHIKDYQMPELAPTNPGNDYGAYQGSAQNHSYVIENVVNVLKNRANITTNALEGLKIVEIIERIYKSAKFSKSLSK